MEQYIYKGSRKLRCGYTTGSCAAAASKAAAMMLLTKKQVKELSLMTPKGVLLTLNIEEITINEQSVRCAVRKDAGDDADCTDGILVFAEASFCREGIELAAGEGIGVVTKPGLEQPVGEAAINSVPRSMIYKEVGEVIEDCSFSGGIHIELSVPEGAVVAKKTFNPRLGIEGGISILGTSGIVEPMSEAALVASIHTEMKMKLWDGRKILLATPGNYGRDFVKKTWGIDLDTVVKCSNFIGETIDMAYEFQLEKLLFIGHAGKLIKVAAGIMNTHSKCADGRMETLCSAAVMAGADNMLCRRLLTCVTTEDALELLREEGLLDGSMCYVMKKIKEHMTRRAWNGLTVEAILFSNNLGVLGATDNAFEFLEEIKG